MTESEWLSAAEPGPMLEFLRGKASERKLRLWACACCRKVWPMLSSWDRERIEWAEQYSDGEATAVELDAVNEIVEKHSRPIALSHAVSYAASNTPSYNALHYSVKHVFRCLHSFQHSHSGNAVLCLFNNPFRPVMFDPAWLTPKVVTLAQQFYDDRAFDRLPSLADALEEAGCEHPEVLAHCRGPGPHVRGCWVVDAVLGKE